MPRQYTLKGKRKASRSPSPSSDSSCDASPSPMVSRNRKRSKTFHEDDFEDNELVAKESNFNSEHSAPSPHPSPSRKASSSIQHPISRKEKVTLELVRAVKKSASYRTGSQHGAGSWVYTMAEQDVKGNLTKKNKGKGKAQASSLDKDKEKGKAPGLSQARPKVKVPCKTRTFGVSSIVFLTGGIRLAMDSERQVNPNYEDLKVKYLLRKSFIPKTNSELRPWERHKVAAISKPGALLGPFSADLTKEEVVAVLSKIFPELFKYLDQTKQDFVLCHRYRSTVYVVPMIKDRPTGQDIADICTNRQAASTVQLIFDKLLLIVILHLPNIYFKATKNWVHKHIWSMWRDLDDLSSEEDGTSSDSSNEESSGLSKVVASQKRSKTRSVKEESSSDEDITMLSNEEEDDEEHVEAPPAASSSSRTMAAIRSQRKAFVLALSSSDLELEPSVSIKMGTTSGEAPPFNIGPVMEDDSGILLYEPMELSSPVWCTTEALS